MPPTRRNFLMGNLKGSVPPAAASAPGPVVAPASGSTTDDEHYLLHVGRHAMACEFEIYLNVGQYPHGMDTALATLDRLEPYEQQLSYFRQTSALSAVNREAADRPVVVDADLFTILQTAAEVFAQTGGAHDITSTPYWEIWGFSRRAGRVPSAAEIDQVRPLVGMDLVELDAAASTVRLRRPGVRLNLGSMGKGYALDRCLAHLAEAGIADVLMHGGGSSVVARGAQASTVVDMASHSQGHWVVGLPHPLRPGQRLGEIHLRDRALGTSGSQAQAFWHAGRRYGHILDPRTGWPASKVFSATALAPTGLLADALSTAFYVMDPDETLSYCAHHPAIGAILALPARRPGGFEVRTAGLAEGELILFTNVDGPGPGS